MTAFRSILDRLGRDENPYPGLRRFETDETHLFFGRDEQTAELVTRLERKRFVAVVGVSGCGKSSLVRAGLIPALQRGSVSASGSKWRIVVTQPGDAPFKNLSAELAKADLDSSPLRRTSLGLVDVAQQLPAGESLLVIVDQFEELFRYKDLEGTGREAAERRRRAAVEASEFVQLLLASSRDQPPVFIVLTMRTEYLGDCAEFRDFAETLNECSYLVPRLTREQRKQAIEGPLGARAQMEPSLVQRLLNDAGDEPDQLPVLQHALMRTWSHWRRADPERLRRIGLEDYLAIGGLDRALNQHGEELLDAPTVRARPDVAMWIFQRLTARGPTRRERRDPATLEEIWAVCGAATDDERRAVNAVIDQFRLGEATFLSPRAALLGPTQFIDITHESLIRQWSRLADDWLPREEQNAKTLIDLLARASAWKAGHGEPLPGLDLSGALKWRAERNQTGAWAEHYIEPSGLPLVLEFINASVAAEKERAARERRGFWALIYALGLTAVVLGGAAAYYFRTTQKSVQTVQTAQKGEQTARGNELIAYSTLLEQADPSALQASLLLAIEGLRMAPSAEALQRVQAVAERLPLPLARLDYKRPVHTVALSADGKYAAIVPEGKEAYLLDVSARRQVASLENDARVNAVAFSPDGTRLATAAANGQVSVWTTADGALETRLPREIPTEAEGLNDVAFHPDGRRFATAGDDRTVRLWDLARGTSTAAVRHDASVYLLAFSRTGDRLASAGDDGGVRMWNVTSGLNENQKPTLFRWKGSVSSLAFAGDASERSTTESNERLISTTYLKTLKIMSLAEKTMSTAGPLPRSLDAQTLAGAMPSSDARPRVLASSPAVVLTAPTRSAANLDNPPRVSQIIVSPSWLFDVDNRGVARFLTTTPAQTDDWIERSRFIHGTVIVSAAAAAAADGQTFVAVTGDAAGSARLWQIEGKEARMALTQDSEQLIAWACRHVTRPLTEDEKFRFVPEASRATCEIPAAILDAPSKTAPVTVP